jgi:molybdopterin/thiamine biosynthesis adenylyltransferase
VTRSWSVRFPQPLYDQLHAHLFPGDGDEHGAVIAAGICDSPQGVRLLARELFCARDGVDYIPGNYGYRMLTGRFVTEKAMHCAEEQLCYLAVHNHDGRGRVAFSRDDWDSHERGYPALLDITGGGPVGALVFAQDAVAGDIWLPDRARRSIDHAVIVGPTQRTVFPEPPPSGSTVDPIYDRHARMFGDLGQQRLGELKVGIIGAGGGGSLLVQMLAHLGVGHLVVVDFDIVEPANLPRIVGATRWDAGIFPLIEGVPSLARLGRRLARRKVDVARWVAKRAQPGIRFEAISGDVMDPATTRLLRDVDALFLATDNMQSRLVFNALVHQYLIPGFQVGAKVRPDRQTHLVDDVFAVDRPVLPFANGGCLHCAGLISPARLALEALPASERIAQRYVDDDGVTEPSVITLNSIGTALAANDLLFMMTGLFADGVDLRHLHYDARSREQLRIAQTATPQCLDCSVHSSSRLGRGDRRRLPCRNS